MLLMLLATLKLMSVVEVDLLLFLLGQCGSGPILMQHVQILGSMCSFNETLEFIVFLLVSWGLEYPSAT